MRDVREDISESGNVEVVRQTPHFSRPTDLKLDLTCGLSSNLADELLDEVSEGGDDYEEEEEDERREEEYLPMPSRKPNRDASLLEEDASIQMPRLKKEGNSVSYPTFHPALKAAVLAEGQEAVWVEDEVSTVSSVIVKPPPKAAAQPSKVGEKKPKKKTANKFKKFLFRQKQEPIPEEPQDEEKDKESEGQQPHKIHVRKTMIKKAVVLLPQLGGNEVKALVEQNVAEEAAVNMVKARQLLNQALIADSPHLEESENLAKVAFAHAAAARRLMATPDEQADLEDVLSILAEKGEHAAFEHQRIVFSQSFDSPKSAAINKPEGLLSQYKSKAFSILESILPKNIAPEVERSVTGWSDEEISTLGFKTDTFEYQLDGKRKQNMSGSADMELMSISSLNEILDGPIEEPSRPSPRHEIPYIDIPTKTSKPAKAKKSRRSVGGGFLGFMSPTSVLTEDSDQKTVESLKSQQKRSRGFMRVLKKTDEVAENRSETREPVEPKRSSLPRDPSKYTESEENSLKQNERDETLQRIKKEERKRKKELEAKKRVKESLAKTRTNTSEQDWDEHALTPEAQNAKDSTIQKKTAVKKNSNKKNPSQKKQPSANDWDETVVLKPDDEASRGSDPDGSRHDEPSVDSSTSGQETNASATPRSSGETPRSEAEQDSTDEGSYQTRKGDTRAHGEERNNDKKAVEPEIEDIEDIEEKEESKMEDRETTSELGRKLVQKRSKEDMSRTDSQTLSKGDKYRIVSPDRKQKDFQPEAIPKRKGQVEKLTLDANPADMVSLRDIDHDSLVDFMISPGRADAITIGGGRVVDRISDKGNSRTVRPVSRSHISEKTEEECTTNTNDHDEATEQKPVVVVNKKQIRQQSQQPKVDVNKASTNKPSTKLMTRLAGIFGNRKNKKERKETNIIPEDNDDESFENLHKAVSEGNMKAAEANLNAEDAPTATTMKQKKSKIPLSSAPSIGNAISKGNKKAQEANERSRRRSDTAASEDPLVAHLKAIQGDRSSKRGVSSERARSRNEDPLVSRLKSIRDKRGDTNRETRRSRSKADKGRSQKRAPIDDKQTVDHQAPKENGSSDIKAKARKEENIKPTHKKTSDKRNSVNEKDRSEKRSDERTDRRHKEPALALSIKRDTATKDAPGDGEGLHLSTDAPSHTGDDRYKCLAPTPRKKKETHNEFEEDDRELRKDREARKTKSTDKYDQRAVLQRLYGVSNEPSEVLLVKKKEEDVDKNPEKKRREEQPEKKRRNLYIGDLLEAPGGVSTDQSESSSESRSDHSNAENSNPDVVVRDPSISGSKALGARKLLSP